MDKNHGKQKETQRITKEKNKNLKYNDGKKRKPKKTEEEIRKLEKNKKNEKK